MDNSIIDSYQSVDHETKRKGVTMGVVGMSLSIFAGLLVFFTTILYFAGGWVLAAIPLVIALAGLGLSIAGKITSAKIGLGNGFGLSGIIVAPIAMLWSLYFLWACYQISTVLSSLDEDIFNNSHFEEAMEDAMKDALEDLDEEY